jgi:hypothetical protein
MSDLGKSWTLLRVVNDETEAHLILGLLRGHGISCRIQSMRVPQYPLTVDGLGEINILVPEEELSEGNRLLAKLTNQHNE